MSVSPITLLLSQHPILRTLATFLSTLDLYNLGRTSHAHFSYVLSSKHAFNILSCESICDGRGLADRQNFQGLYSLARRSYVWGNTRKIWQDEPIEVELYGAKCDAAHALPCRKCGVNICEVHHALSQWKQAHVLNTQECRYYPREPPHAGYPRRRPYLNSPWQNENVMCLCDQCDARLESELRGKFLNELCDCDIYTRWICHKCVREERKFTRQYYEKYTSHDWDPVDDPSTELEFSEPGKVMGDHQHTIAVCFIGCIGFRVCI